MNPTTQRVRQTLGILTICVILSLTIAEAFLTSVTIEPGRLNLLIGLAGGLLGLDATREYVTQNVLEQYDIGISITPKSPENPGDKD